MLSFVNLNVISGGTLLPRMNTIITISCVCWAFIISYIPTFIVVVMKTIDPYLIPRWFEIIQLYGLSINTTVNFFIYIKTNKRFQNFVKCLWGKKGVVNVRGSVSDDAGRKTGERLGKMGGEGDNLFLRQISC